MLDLTTATRSQVLKLQFNYNDFELFYKCLAAIWTKKEKLTDRARELLQENISDLEILLAVMREEGNIE